MNYAKLTLELQPDLVGDEVAVPGLPLRLRPPKGWTAFTDAELAAMAHGQSPLPTRTNEGATTPPIPLVDTPVAGWRAKGLAAAWLILPIRAERVPSSADPAFDLAKALVAERRLPPTAGPQAVVVNSGLRVARIAERDTATRLTLVVELNSTQLVLMTLFCANDAYDKSMAEQLTSVIASLRSAP